MPKNGIRSFAVANRAKPGIYAFCHFVLPASTTQDSMKAYEYQWESWCFSQMTENDGSRRSIYQILEKVLR